MALSFPTSPAVGQVYASGVVQRPGTDYTRVSGGIQFTTAASANTGIPAMVIS